jgi:glycosyltransferase involved in cell wall biosynthesis
VIRNALPLDEIETVQPATWGEIGLESEQQIVLYVGRFHPHKNLSTLLLALSEVVSRPGAVAVLCGDGPLKELIKWRLKEYLIAGRVLLPGYVSAVWNWMKRADVVVSVSLLEGHPNAVLEAMACGCPLVVSDIASHREFLDEQSALLVDPRAPDEIARAIRSVLSDPEAAERRALNARARVAQWSILAIARQYERVYEQVLDRNKPQRHK